METKVGDSPPELFIVLGQGPSMNFEIIHVVMIDHFVLEQKRIPRHSFNPDLCVCYFA